MRLAIAPNKRLLFLLVFAWLSTDLPFVVNRDDVIVRAEEERSAMRNHRRGIGDPDRPIGF